MIKTRITAAIAASSVFLFSMCDLVPSPHAVTNTVIPAFDTSMRVALLEEWTGHICTNCPDAATIITSIKNLYHEKFIAISIHDGYFAEPCGPSYPAPPVPNCASSFPGAFTLDLRCATASSYSSAHGGIANINPPVGMVNRQYMSNGMELLERGNWAAEVSLIVDDSASSSLHIDHNFNSSTQQLAVTVWGTWLRAPYTGNVNVAIMLTESGILDWQQHTSGCYQNYEFNDVLRDCINTPGSITGTPVSTGTAAEGSVWSYTLPGLYTLPSGVNPANCHLVALIYDTTTGEVIQAREVELQ